MEPWHTLHEVRGGVIAEVGGEVADSQSPTARGKTLGEGVGRFVESSNLWGQCV